MNYSLFAGLEAFVEDDPVEATAPVTIQPEEHIEEVSEAEAAATEQGELNTELQEIDDKAEMVFAKFTEIDRMIAHIQRYGVDRSFLSLCNHDNILNRAFNLQLPSCESFDVVGSSSSATSIAALEGLKEVATKVYDFIVSMCLRLKDWIVRVIKMYNLRIDSLEKRAKALDALVKTNTELRELSAEDEEKLNGIKVYGESQLDIKLWHVFESIKSRVENFKTIDELNNFINNKGIMDYYATYPEKKTLAEEAEVLKQHISWVSYYPELALKIVDEARQMLDKTLPDLRKDVEKLKSDVNSKKIDEETAKLQLAKNKFLIKTANESIGKYLKLGNEVVSSGSTVMAHLYKKPGSNDADAAEAK